MLSKNDINIQLDNKIFKLRVAGIVENNGKILLTKMRENEFFCFPGGHSQILEDSKKAAFRELKEELYFDFEVMDLIYVHENIFCKASSQIHELCFYYKIKVKDKSFKENNIIWKENDNGEILYHDYRWINLLDIDKYDIRPKVIVDSYIKDNSKFKYLISNQIN